MLTLLVLVAAATPHLSVSTKDIRLEGRVLVSPLPADEFLNIPAVEEALRSSRRDGGPAEFELEVEPAVTFATFKKVLFSMASAGAPARSFRVGSAVPLPLGQGGGPVPDLSVRVPVNVGVEGVVQALRGFQKKQPGPVQVGFIVVDEVTLELLARLMTACREAGFTEQFVVPATVKGPAAADQSVAEGPGGKTLVRGSLDREQILKVLKTNREMTLRCAEAAFKATPDLAGTVSVSFVIGATGDVSSAEVGTDRAHSPSFSKCLVEAVKTWKFPAPRGGGVVHVTYPFLFELRSED